MSSLLLHSVSYAGFWGQATLDVHRFVEKAAELGFDGVELMAKRPHVSALDWDAAACAALREKMAKLGLRNTCLAGYVNLTGDLEHSEIPHREISVTYLAALCRLARDLGASSVRIFTGYESAAAPVGAQWRLIVDSLREAADQAGRYGVTLGVQNHHDIAVGYESFHDLIAEVNHTHCRAMFDAWAPALHGADLKTAARKLAPMTIHTTVADYQLRPRYRYQPALVNYEAQTPATVAVPMGEGFIDYGAFFAGLREGGFTGSVAYEMCSPLRDGASMDVLDRYARAFLAYMRA